MKRLLIASSLALAAVSCTPSTSGSRVDTLPYYADASFTPLWLEPGAEALDTLHRVAPFALTNQLGDLVTQETVQGSITITDFFFTSCPGICPKMQANMGELQTAFLEDEDVILLSHSVTPERDSVAVLQAYGQEHGVLPERWHLLTGDRQEIYQLGRHAYFVEEDLGLTREADEFLHTENFVLVDDQGHIRGIYNGLDKTDVQQLIEDVRTLQSE